MRRCDHCDSPAVRRFILGTAKARAGHVCYEHALAEGVLDLPVERLGAVSERTGCPFNAAAFVLESVGRCGSVDGAAAVSRAVVRGARERFSGSAREVLEAWGIRDRSDIGRIYLALVAVDLLPRLAGVEEPDFDVPFTLADVLEAP